MVKKLNPISVQKSIAQHGIAVFTPREFEAMFAVSSSAARKFIHQYVGKGLFVKLRNNLYAIEGKAPSPYVVANALYQPSYVSLEAALSYHQLIPEVVYSITSVTTKAAREFSATEQTFTYTRIKRSAFQGYRLLVHGTDRFLMAEPEKAVADYLYLVALGHRTLNDRIRWGRISRAKLRQWVTVFRHRRLTSLVNELQHAHYHTP